MQDESVIIYLHLIHQLKHRHGNGGGRHNVGKGWNVFSRLGCIFRLLIGKMDEHLCRDEIVQY